MSHLVGLAVGMAVFQVEVPTSHVEVSTVPLTLIPVTSFDSEQEAVVTIV